MDVIGNPQIADLAERTQFVVSMGYPSRAIQSDHLCCRLKKFGSQRLKPSTHLDEGR
jgi:hypothetical protein